ncbi:hypothetical protein G210_0591 [Candida maltosa Xu316]|uniref:Uncharacterized protein n=1 Tax=Candida maltosa (strain Xu316) TaxID=1245528 RepID=M3IQM8_CANMX|nr:hypothetical protein G210_0591 [Candida maltosa Xu316]
MNTTTPTVIPPTSQNDIPHKPEPLSKLESNDIDKSQEVEYTDDDVSLFDHIWSLTTTEETIPVHDLFRLLRNLEVELLQATTKENTKVDSFFLTNDQVIKAKIVAQCEFLETVDKHSAFLIICQSLKDFQIIETPSMNAVSELVIESEDGLTTRGNDFDETSTLMESGLSSPITDDSEFVGSVTNLDLAWKELEMMQEKLDKGYLSLEDELSSIKVKNNLDLNELGSLVKSNDNVINRIDNIRSELFQINNSLGSYRDSFHVEKSGSQNNSMSCILNEDHEDLVLEDLENMCEADASWSTENTPVTLHAFDNMKDESDYDVLHSTDIKIDEDENKEDEIVKNDEVFQSASLEEIYPITSSDEVFESAPLDEYTQTDSPEIDDVEDIEIVEETKENSQLVGIDGTNEKAVEKPMYFKHAYFLIAVVVLILSYQYVK